MTAALTALLVAGIALLGVLYGQLMHRMSRLEDSNRSLWAYTRRLLDLYYRHRIDGAPDPDPLPDDI